MTNLITIPQGLITPLSQPLEDVYNGLIQSQHQKTTQKTYKQGLKHFANYLLTGASVLGQKIDLSEVEVKAVMMEYLQFDAKTANAYLASYQTAMIESGYNPNSINIKIASVKALVRYAFDYEQSSFLLDKVKSLTPEVYRDTKGTTPENIKSMLALPDTTTVKGKRDYAILRLLWDCGLRRGEVSNLNIADFNEGDRSLQIKGKGKLSKEVIYLSPQCTEAIKQWLDSCFIPDNITDCVINKNQWLTGVNADRTRKYEIPLSQLVLTAKKNHKLAEIPLFISLDNATNGHRLTTKSIYRITKKYSGDVPEGKVLSPHQVRHSAITAVLDASNGNVRLAQKFSRHKNLDVLTRYDDNRVQLQKEAVNLLADMV